MAARGASSYYDCNLDARRACTWNALLLCLDAISMLSVLFVFFRATIACYKGERPHATAIERMLCMWTFALLTCDLLYHAADIIFVLDKDTMPFYFIMTKSAVATAELERTTVHEVVREGVGLCCIWCHCNISCAMFHWIVRRSLMGRRLRVRLSIVLVAMAVSALRISLVKLRRKDVLIASAVLYHGLLIPAILAFTGWRHIGTLLHINALRRQRVGSRRRLPLYKEASGCSGSNGHVEKAEEDLESAHSGWPSELTIAPAIGAEMRRLGTGVGRGSIHRDSQLLNVIQLQGTIWRIVCGLLALWLTGSVTELVVWGWWVTHSAPPSVAVFVLQLVASRLIGFADAVVMGRFCVLPRRQDAESAQQSTRRRVRTRLEERMVQRWSWLHRRRGQAGGGLGGPPATSPEFMYVPSNLSRGMWSPCFPRAEPSHSASNRQEVDVRESF